MSGYVINGRFLSRPMTGVDRFAYELVRELDEMRSAHISLAVPKGVDTTKLPFHHIPIVSVGRLRGILWEQMALPLYCLAHRATPVNLCNTAPLLFPGIVCIHDMQVRVHPENYTRPFVWWYRLLYWVETHRAKRLLTVSQFSRGEILKYYPCVQESRISVVYNGWQHMDRIRADESVLKRLYLKAGRYYYALAGVSRNKNLPWLCAAARRAPESTFVVSGVRDGSVFAANGIGVPANLILTGRVSDGEMKALMHHAKAFLFPSFYEGFGIPPLEALASGCRRICVSRTSALMEVFGAAALYVDPHDRESALPEGAVDARAIATVLERYSWRKSAEVISKL